MSEGVNYQHDDCMTCDTKRTVISKCAVDNVMSPWDGLQIY